MILSVVKAESKETCAVPRALRLDEMGRLVDDYRRAAEHALEAGFDGVELHAAHGYLVDQFLQACAPLRVRRARACDGQRPIRRAWARPSCRLAMAVR